jgi:hypothetical protein
MKKCSNLILVLNLNVNAQEVSVENPFFESKPAETRGFGWRNEVD